MESAEMEIDQEDGSAGADIDQELESGGNDMDLLLECENVDTDSDTEEESDCEDDREGNIHQEEATEDEIEEQASLTVEKNVAPANRNSLVVTDLEGKDFNLKYIQETGLQYPIIFRKKSGLDMRMPGIRARDVKSIIGSDLMVNMMDSRTQKNTTMTVGEWEKYRETKEKDKELSVVSFEFSHTKLDSYIDSLSVVREIDWVEIAWPQQLKVPCMDGVNAREKMTYPKVQKYCYISLKDCYTEFRIDFAGASVWYYMLHGEQVYWLFPPTAKNLSLYENWVLSGNEGDVLADSLEDCQKITLLPGNTFIIPSGWIYAVYALKDSLVYGGYFLHSYNIDRQLMVLAVEEKLQVPEKSRYPFYTELCWYMLEHYVHCMTGQTYLEEPKITNDLELNKSGVSSSPEIVASDIKTENVELEQDTVTTNQSKCVGTNRTENSDSYAQLSRRQLRKRKSPRRLSGSKNGSSLSDNPRRSLEADKRLAVCKKSSSDNSNSMEDIHIESKQNEALTEAKVNSQADEHIGKSDSSAKKKLEPVHLTKYEKIGLRKLVQWIEDLPAVEKRIPKDLINPEAVIREIKLILEKPGNDSENVAATGKPAEEQANPGGDLQSPSLREQADERVEKADVEEVVMEEHTEEADMDIVKEEPDIEQYTTLRCDKESDGLKCVNSVPLQTDTTPKKFSVSNKEIGQEDDLPKPVVILKQHGKGVVVSWNEPQLNSTYSMLVYVVNVLGAKFADAVNSNYRSKKYLWGGSGVVLGKQHSWIVNDENHCYIEGLLPSCRYRVFVTAKYLVKKEFVKKAKYCVKKESHLQEVEKESDIIVFTAHHNDKPPFTGMPKEGKVLRCSMLEFSQIVHNYALKPRSEFSQIVHNYALKPRSDLTSLTSSANMKKNKLTGYILFNKEKRHELLESYELSTGHKIDFGEISKIVGARWTSLTEQEKVKWIQKAERENKQQQYNKKESSQLQSQRCIKKESSQLQSQRYNKKESSQLQSQRYNKKESSQLQSQSYNKKESSQLQSQRYTKKESSHLQSEMVKVSSMRSGLRSQEAVTNSPVQETFSDKINEVAEQQDKRESGLKTEAVTDSSVRSKFRSHETVTKSPVQETIPDQMRLLGYKGMGGGGTESRLKSETVKDSFVRSKFRSHESVTKSPVQETRHDQLNEVARQQGGWTADWTWDFSLPKQSELH